jgi:glutathione S-transferase
MGKVFFNLVVKPKLFGQPGDMAAVDKALKDELPPLFDYLERTIDGPFLVGHTISLADIAVAMPLINLQLCEHPVDAKRWPKLTGWLDAVLARRSFQGISDEKAAA